MVATQPVSMRGATVTPVAPFRPDEDVKKLYEAIHVTKDNNGISSVLCFRSNAQRQEIAKRYRETFRKQLLDDVNCLTGEFKELVVALLEESVVFDAKQLKTSLREQKGLALMELLFTRSSAHLEKVKKAYRDIYQNDVDDDLDKENKLHDRLLLKFLVDCKRDETAKVDPVEAEHCAQALCHPQTEQQHVAAGKLYELLATKSHEQLRSIFDRYELMSGYTVEQLIEADFPGNDEGVCLMAAVRAVRSTANFFAAELKAFFNEKNHAEIGHSDVIRIIVSRCEIDLGDILEEYVNLSGMPFELMCKEFDGSYGNALYALCTQIPMNASESLRYPLSA